MFEGLLLNSSLRVSLSAVATQNKTKQKKQIIIKAEAAASLLKFSREQQTPQYEYAIQSNEWILVSY